VIEDLGAYRATELKEMLRAIEGRGKSLAHRGPGGRYISQAKFRLSLMDVSGRGI